MKTAAVITGGSSGLGKSLLEKIEKDFDFVLNIDLKKGVDTTKEINLSELIPKDHKIELLINNASKEHINWLEDTMIEEALSVIKTNVFGYFNVSKECVKHSLGEGGTIINVCSISSRVPQRASCLYNSTKAAQVMMTKQLARELWRHKITVFGFNLGLIKDTPMTKRVEEKVLKVRNWKKDYADKYQYNYIPVERPTDTKEVSEFIYKTYQNRTSYLTGSVIDFSGGY